MGSKKINGYWLIQNGVMTGTSVLSGIQNVQNFDNIGIEFTWTSTAVGTIAILGSVSAGIEGVAATTYYALSFSPSLTNPSGSAGGYLVSLNQFPYPYLKVQYTNVSSTGVLNVYLFSKDMN